MSELFTTSRADFGRWHAALLVAIAAAAVTAVAGFRAVLADWSFMVTAVLAGAGAAAVVGISWSKKLLIGETVAAAAVAMIVIGTIATNGLPTTDAFRVFFDGLVNGWADLLSQTPPLDVTPEQRVLPFSLAWVGTIIGGELVRRSGAPVVSTIGPLIALAVSVLVTAENRTVGIVQGTVIAVVALGIGVAQSRRTAKDRRSVIRSEVARQQGQATSDERIRRRTFSVGLTLAFIALVAPALGPRLPFAAANERFDLRDRNEPPWDPLAIPSPLVELKGQLREALRDEVVFTVQSDATIDRFGLAVLGAYDGVVWTVGSTDAADPRLEFRPVGSRLPARPTELDVPVLDETITVTIASLDGPWLPLAGWPTEITFTDGEGINQDLRMNLVTGTVALPTGINAGLTYTIDTEVPVRPSDAALRNIEVRTSSGATDDNVVIPAAIRNIAADVLEGVDPGWDQLVALENKFVTDGFYDTSPQSRPGHSYFRLSQFLADPDRLVGFEEQYVAAAATISELAQLPTRVVVGYLVPASRYNADGVAEVVASDINAWIEVDFGTQGWISVDVTPDRSREPVAEAVGRTIEEVAVPSPPPPPQIPPDPEVFSSEEEPEETDDDEEDEDPADDENGSSLSPARALAIGSAGIGGLAVITMILIAAWKALRRRRRRKSPVPATTIGWAWRETLDRYGEAGIHLPTDVTPQEAVRMFLATEPTAATSERQLRSMVSVVERSAFHVEPPEQSIATEAWTYYDGVVDALRAERNVFERAKMIVDPRPLRRHRWAHVEADTTSRTDKVES